MADGLSHDEIRELAQRFSDLSAVRQVLARAGWSMGQLPSWRVDTSEQFWHEVSRLLADGLVSDGRRHLLEAVKDLSSGNAGVADGHGGVAGRFRRVPSRDLLPLLPPRFVARDGDVAAVRELLLDAGSGPVVGVVGMGGAGKSTLARALAKDDEVRKAFPDGIVWVDVNPHPDLAAVQTQVLSAFGSPEPVVDVQAGAIRLRQLLAGAVCLIAADNVWDRDVLAALPVPAGSRLLVTTRDRDTLYTDSVAYMLEQVDDEMARRLLARYAGCHLADLPDEADEIVRRCGGLVLALVVLGGMAGEGRRWATVAARLRRADLAWFAGRFSDYPDGLLAALDASVSALDDQEANRFRELIVFEGRGSVPTSVAGLLWKATSGLDELDADDVLSMLGRRSLVQIDPANDSFTLHDLLFDYTRATLPPGRHEQLHGVLAQCLVSRWGGLEDALPALLTRTGFDAVDRYGLSALVAHLLAADEPDTVDAVLAAERAMADRRPESTWYLAHENQASPGEYLADVRAAWQDTRTRYPADDSRGLARQVGYALLLGSITRLAANIPPPLLVRLVDTGLWPPARALPYAQAMPHPPDRAKALAGLAAHLPAEQRCQVLAQALASAMSIHDGHGRARALTELVAHLPAEQRGPVLAQALDAVTAIDNWDSQAEELIRLAAHLPADLLGSALTAASAMNGSNRVRVLTRLATRLPVEKRDPVFEQTLGEALAIETESTRAQALTDLAEYLPADLVASALTATSAIDSPSFQAEILPKLAARLPREQRGPILTQALSAATAIKYPDDRARELTRLAAQMPAEQRGPILTQALTAAASIYEGGHCAAALTGLGALLPTALLAQALTAATAITDPNARARALCGLAAHWPAEQRGLVLAQALTAASAIEPPFTRARTLTGMAAHWPAAQRDPILALALTAAAAVDAPLMREEALSELSARLPAGLLAQALTAATTTRRDSYPWAMALIRLAPHLPVEQRDPILARALTTAAAIYFPDNRAHALTLLVPQLHAEQRGPVLAQALNTAICLKSEYDRARAVSRLAAHLPADLIAQALTAAVAIKGPSARAEALSGLAAHLPADLIAQALTAALAIEGHAARAWALTGLAPHLPADQRGLVVAQALTAATATYSPEGRTRALSGLAPQLPAELMASALTTATAIYPPADRARALVGLAAHLSADLLTQALSAAADLGWPYIRAKALTGFTPHVPADQRDTVLAQALSAAKKVDEPTYRIAALTGLAVYLPAEQRGPVLAQALTAVAAIHPPEFQAKALTRMAPHLPADLLGSAVAAATAINVPSARAEALTELAAHLPADQRGQVLDQALASASLAGIVSVVRNLPGVLSIKQQDNILASYTVSSLLRVQRWWP